MYRTGLVSSVSRTRLFVAFTEFFKSVVGEIKKQGDQLAIRTSPGSAMLLKNRLLTRFEPLIFTVLSDDDTILLIATSEETAEKIYSDLSN